MALFASVTGQSAAVAQDEVPKSGDFALRYTWTNPTTLVFGEVSRGGDKGSVRAGGWIGWLMRNDVSSGFGHKMTGKCVAMFGMNAPSYDLVLGDCDYTDGDGDKLSRPISSLVTRRASSVCL
ncbi:MAG: hypothetical protein IPK28_06885 [Devosia sp.]|nr:hypothetical protein [Devosia sp.]